MNRASACFVAIANLVAIPRWLAVPTLTAIATFVAVTGAQATTALRPLTIDELTARSDLVVHGTIRSSESELVPERGIFTRIEVSPLELLKGELVGETANLRVYGGAWQDLVTRVEGGPCLGDNEEVVLFLISNGPSTYDVVNLAEGKFAVDRADAGPAGVTRDLSGIAYLDPSVSTAIPTDLDELKTAIRNAAR